jgi:hypothetical protein
MSDEYMEYRRICFIMGVETLFAFKYCPDCGKILNRVRQPIWSHDHSLEIGYTMRENCIFCPYTEVYHDVE